MIELKNIKIVKDNELVLDNINLKFNNNGLIIFKGKFKDRQPLLKILAGYEKAESGEFFLNEKLLNYNNKKELDQYRFKYVATALRENNFFEFLTVRENFELLNFYSRNIKEEDILQVLDFLGLDQSVLDLKSRALSKDVQQLLALSKPLLMKNNIIIVENPLKYLDTQEEVERVSNILEKISKERLLFVFTNKDSEFDKKADQVVNLKDKTISNIQYNQTNQIYKENVEIDKSYLLKKPLFIQRVSFFLTKFNLVRNIILVILLSFAIALLSVTTANSFVQKSDKSIYQKVQEDKDPYLYLSSKMNLLEENTELKLLDKNTAEEKKLINENSFKRYLLSNTPYVDTKVKTLPLSANSFIEVPNNHIEEYKTYLDERFENSKFPENQTNQKIIEIAVTYEIALDIAKQFTLNENDLFKLTNNRFIRVVQFGNRTGSTFKVVGVFKQGLSIPKGVYSYENSFTKLNIQEDKRDFFKTELYIDTVYLNNEIQDTTRIDNNFNKLSGLKVYTKKASTITQAEYDQYFDFVSTYTNPIVLNGDITKLNLKDDEIVLTLDMFNTFVRNNQIQFENNVFNRNIMDNLEIDITVNLDKLLPVDNIFGFMKFNKLKVVGLLTPKNANTFRFPADLDKQYYLNNFIILSDNNISKFRTNLEKPIEYFLDKKLVNYELFSKNYNFSKSKIEKNTLLFTNSLITNENFVSIISGESAVSVVRLFIPIAVFLLLVAIYLSVKLTRGRLNKKVNLYSMFWSAGRSSRLIKLSYAMHILILFGFILVLSIGLGFVFMQVFDRLAGFANGITVYGLYRFNILTILSIFGFTTVLYLVFTLINTLLITRHVLTSDKDFL